MAFNTPVNNVFALLPAALQQKWLVRFADNEYQNISEAYFREFLLDLMGTFPSFAALNVKLVKGATYPVPFTDSLGIIPAAYRIVGMQAMARIGTDAGTAAALNPALLPGPKYYQLLRDSAGPVAALLDEEPTTVLTTPARWVLVSGTDEERMATFEAWVDEDRTPFYKAGDVVYYDFPGNIRRLIQIRYDFTTSINPVPTGLDSDPNYAPFAPLAAAAIYTDSQAISAAFGDRFKTLTRAAYLDLVDEEQAPKPGTTYRISDAPGGSAEGTLAITSPRVMEAAVRAGFAGLWRYDITANTFVEASGGVADGSITDAKLAAEVKVGALSGLLTTVKTSVVGALNELWGLVGTNTTNITTNTSAIGTLASLTTTVKTSLVGAINDLKALVTDNTSNIGSLASLSTTAKGNLVAAINEVRNTVPTFATVQTANFTITAAMVGMQVEVNSAALVTVTVPTTLPAGSVIFFLQAGTGQIAFVGASGMSVKNPDNLTRTRRQESGATIHIRPASTTTCNVTGDLVS